MASKEDNSIVAMEKDMGDEIIEYSPNDTTFHSTGSDEEELKKTGAPRKRCNRWLPLGIGVVVLGAIGAGVYFFLDNNEVALNASEVQNQDFQGTVSKAELFQHSEVDDCWLLIGGSVYDLTDYAPDHPGGGDLITDMCGTDGTKEYEMTHALSLMKTLPETLLGTIEAGYVPPVVDEDEDEDDEEEFVYVPPTAQGTDPPVQTDPPVETEPPVDTEPPAQTDPPSNVFDDSFLGGLVRESTAFISEIHYDNIGGDVNQMIEVAFSNQLDVSGYTVEFYRGSTGKVYDVQTLQAFAIGNSVNGLTFASRIVKSFQNGPDGVALIDSNANIVEFISYGGVIVPEEGVAAGMSSVDIGIEQNGQDPIGHTLQKTGAGCLGESFVWGVNGEGTPGDVNIGMEVTCYAEGDTVPAPAPWAETFAPTPTCFAEHFDLATLALHSTPGDCWEAIFGLVYDFSEWAFEHTGGPDDVLPHCGTDTSEAYLDRHSRGLMKYVVQHIIGRLTEAEEGVFSVPCERRLERADSGYWDHDWESVEEFEEYNWVLDEDAEEES